MLPGEAILPIFQPEQPSPWWSVLTFAVVAGALWARFIAQPGMHEDKGDGERVTLAPARCQPSSWCRHRRAAVADGDAVRG